VAEGYSRKFLKTFGNFSRLELWGGKEENPGRIYPGRGILKEGFYNLPEENSS